MRGLGEVGSERMNHLGSWTKALEDDFQAHFLMTCISKIMVLVSHMVVQSPKIVLKYIF